MIHRAEAIARNHEVWSLLERANRSPEDDRMLQAAQSSLEHWLLAGGPVEEARGEWLPSHVHAVLGHPDLASHHARRTSDVCEAHADVVADFDHAYALEALARAAAVAGDHQAFQLRKTAKEAGTRIADPEDRQIFVGDLAGEPWYGAPDDGGND